MYPSQNRAPSHRRDRPCRANPIRSDGLTLHVMGEGQRDGIGAVCEIACAGANFALRGGSVEFSPWLFTNF